MNPEEIKKIQREIREFYPPEFREGCDDGFWGSRSIRAAQRFLLALCPRNPWPKSTQSALREFYGEPGDESRLVMIDLPYPMFYDGKRVIRTRCHQRVAPSLLRVLRSIGDLYNDRPDIMEEAEDYSGVFNFRLKRGGSSYSMHAYGAAIDLDADDNAFRQSWPVSADMNWEIIKEFAREGWTSAAVWWGYDAMHFEASSR